MARVHLLAFVALVTVAACTENLDPVGAPPPRGRSRADGTRSGPAAPAGTPRLDAVVEGRVVVAGKPLGGATVEVTSSPSAGEEFRNFFSFNPSRGGTPFRTATRPDGRFAATLPKAHLPGFETDTDWFIRVSLPPRDGLVVGPATVEEFEVAAATQASPDLHLWNAPPEVSHNDGRVVVTWPDLGYGHFDRGQVDYELTYLDERHAPVWSLEGVRPGDAVDARLLEDVRGRVVLMARGKITSGPTIYHQTLTAPQPAFSGTAGIPLSRGRPCTLAAEGGAPQPPLPCWLTDGDLAAPRPGPPTCSPLAADPDFAFDRRDCQEPIAVATIDLGKPFDIGLIVVRRCRGCSVEVSDDGSAWQPVGIATGRPGEAIVPPRGTRARFARVSHLGGGVDAVGELSIWPPLAQGAEPTSTGLVGEPRPGRGAGGSAAGVAALVLLVVASSLLFWTLGRRFPESWTRS